MIFVQCTKKCNKPNAKIWFVNFGNSIKKIESNGREANMPVSVCFGNRNRSDILCITALNKICHFTLCL